MSDTPTRTLLPEKVLQFGTGILLRGLPDYFIDQANRKGIFVGAIVVIKSTPGTTADFDKEDFQYTVCIRGIDRGTNVEDDKVIGAISRVLPAREQWTEILEVAASPHLQIIVSNTTEVGIQ